MAYISAANSPYPLLLPLQNGNVNAQETRLEVDTTTGAVTILLPAIANVPKGYYVKIFIVDVLGNAGTHNITAQATGGNTINGNATVVVGQNFGFVKLEIGASGQWVAYGSESAGGALVLTNGLTLLGSTGYLGGTLIHNASIAGLETYPLAFKSTDGSFYVASGNLSAAPYSLAANSFSVNSTTLLQTLGLSVKQNGNILLANVDSVSSITRAINVISTSNGSSGFPTGGIVLREIYAGGFTYTARIYNNTLSLAILNTSLSAPNQVPAEILISNDQVLCYKYISNADQTGISNGWDINAGTGGGSDHAAMFWHGAIGAFGNNGSAVLQINSAGLSFSASANSGSAPILVFSVSPTGTITTVLPSSNAGLTTGELYRSSASANATVMVV